MIHELMMVQAFLLLKEPIQPTYSFLNEEIKLKIQTVLVVMTP